MSEGMLSITQMQIKTSYYILDWTPQFFSQKDVYPVLLKVWVNEL